MTREELLQLRADLDDTIDLVQGIQVWLGARMLSKSYDGLFYRLWTRAHDLKRTLRAAGAYE